MEKRRILCYGDSNTWGTIPRWVDSSAPSERYDENTRWTMVAQKLLGEEYDIIEAGLGGRTTIYDGGCSWKNGLTHLPVSLHGHRPLDLVVVMLGTNDLHIGEPKKESELGIGIRKIIQSIQHYPKCGRGALTPKILVVAPIEVWPSAPDGRVGVYPKFHGEWGTHLSRQFPRIYGEIAEETGCYFLDASLYAQPSPGDGVHFDSESHVRLGRAMAEKIQEIFADETAVPNGDDREVVTTGSLDLGNFDE